MTMMPKSLSGRLILTALTVIVVSVATTGMALEFTLHRFVQGQVDGRLDGQIANIRAALEQQPDGRFILAHGVDGPPFDRPLFGWYWKVTWSHGELKSASLQGQDFTSGPLPPDDHPHPVAVDGRGPGHDALRVRAKRFRVLDDTVVIKVAAPERALTGPLREAMIPVAISLAALTVMLAGGALLQVRLGLRPLAILRRDLGRIRDGDADHIDRAQPAEIAPLVEDLNALLDQNTANLERARRHVANLAHGLKTPLASLSLALDDRSAIEPQRLRPLVSAMEKMIRHHLSRARMAASVGSPRARANLSQKIADHVAVFTKIYADKNLGFSIDAGRDMFVACEDQDLDEILGNLLDNACQWARENVSIRAGVDGGHVTVSIIDDGPGVSGDQLARILYPGYRLDESLPGYGFGLAITRELAELYNGSLNLKNADASGLEAIVHLPGVKVGTEWRSA